AQVHELTPIELGVLPEGGLFAPVGVIGPELFTDVGEFEPGVDQDALPVGGGDEVSEVRILFGIGFKMMPGGDVQGCDSRLAPARREVVQIDAAAVGAVEKGPEAVASKGRIEA